MAAAARGRRAQEPGADNDLNRYFQQLPDFLFLKNPTPAEFMERSAAIREAIRLPTSEEGPAHETACLALRIKYGSHMGCGMIPGLADAAHEGSMSRMEGLILRDHLGHNLRRAHATILKPEQDKMESIRAYTIRLINLWHAIDRVTLVTPEDEGIENQYSATRDLAVRDWINGIRQPALTEFMRRSLGDSSFRKGDETKLMDKCKEAEKALEEQEEFQQNPLLRAIIKPANSKQQRQIMAVTTTSDYTGNTSSEGQQSARQGRRPSEGQQGRPEIRVRGQTIPCDDCTTGTFTIGQGCSNPECKTKFRHCHFCMKWSFSPRTGCTTPGCQSKRTSRGPGNGRARGH